MKKRILGFTLIELLIVITIIGILAVVFIPTVMGAPEKARDAARKADVASIIKGIEAARLENTVNWDSTTAPYIKDGCGVLDGAISANLVKYFPGGKIPSDPSGTGNKAVGTPCGTDGQYAIDVASVGNYSVYARMENATNQKVKCPGDSANTYCSKTDVAQ